MSSPIKIGEIIHTTDGVFYTRHPQSGDYVAGNIAVARVNDSFDCRSLQSFCSNYTVTKRELSVGGLWMRGILPVKGMLIKHLLTNNVYVVTAVLRTHNGRCFVDVHRIDNSLDTTSFAVDGSLLRCVVLPLTPHNNIE